MRTSEYYSLNRAARVLGENRNLVTYLVRDHQIPVQWVGSSKCLDEAGFQKLKAALSAYRRKPDAVAN